MDKVAAAEVIHTSQHLSDDEGGLREVERAGPEGVQERAAHHQVEEECLAPVGLTRCVELAEAGEERGNGQLGSRSGCSI